MQVVRARSAGFCLGVSLALRRLDLELDRAGGERKAEKKPYHVFARQGRLITLGPIIHNPLVMQEYIERGVICEEDCRGVGPGDRVVIRAHGIPRDVEARLMASGATLIDATCPKVKKAQVSIGNEHAKGGFLLLFGEKDHPEVRGLLSYAGNRAMVFGDLRELADLPLEAGRMYFLAAQTTQDRGLFLQAGKYLRKRLGRTVSTLNTICDATRDRQQEVIDLAGKVQAMVVVGGLNSGNTRRLAEVARANGLVTIHVEQANDITPKLAAGTFAGIALVGLTAGASTPEKHIHAMQAYLESI
ncbi:MAG: 4-hydroxy-3-methylbut-2-enyl diphosphate reductase [Desulfovibrio sp.]|jgi:4-hydroxy-3-methylbut-2-enyl diphosphate reductase|nr:4-hydroxy-3-methylbut-2-enyl diphosphate reductase [Desulfovibrio sp.]